MLSVNATTLQDLYNELSNLQSSYNSAQKKANLTQSELNSVKANIYSIETEISNTQNEITKAEKDISNSEKEIENKKNEVSQMMLYLQLTGSKGNNVLEYVFDADDYTDFIYRYSVVSQMSDYNNSIVEDLEKDVKKLQQAKVDLANKQNELGSKKQELQKQYAIVNAQYQDQQSDGMSIQEEINSQKKLIKKYENMGCKKSDNINNCTKATSVGGWTYPLKHFIQSSIYAEARGGVRHYAVDLAVSEGSSVYAVADGIVKSASVNASGCGGMVIRIVHGGGSYTSLYMHLINNYVSAGDEVKAGQVIGTSGGGPQEIAKWGDGCTEGAHLHFAMANGTYIGSSSEKGSTFDPVKFFPAMRGYGASM